MAKIEMRGLDEYTRALSRLELGTREKVIGPAIYEGAKIAADAVQSAISSIPIDSGWGTPEHPQHGINVKQKAALHQSFGISKMRNDSGVYNVKLGFDGYNEIKTKRWPQGQPNAMIARALERGTSWLKPYKFVKQALAGARKKVIAVMRAEVDKGVNETMRK